MTSRQVVVDVARHPVKYFLLRWNWKSAFLSGVMRAPVFFLANLPVSVHAASMAFLAELAFRAATSGFYGSLTEALGQVEPPADAMIYAMVVMPLISHALEFLFHALRGTPNLGLSILSSMAMTGLTTAFNLYLMRRGVLIVGEGRRSLGHDLVQIPGHLVSFTAACFRNLVP